jgi:hypothetical protein
LIGKLIIIGIIIITLVILVLNSSKLFQNILSLDTIKEKIDHATSDKYTINTSKSTIKEISMGGKFLDINSSTDTSASSNSTVYQLPAKYVDQENYTGQVFEKTGNTCEISIPTMAQSINGQKEITHVIQLGQCSLNIGDPIQVTTLTAKPDAPVVNPSNGLKIIPYSRDRGTSLPTLPDYYNMVQLSIVNQGIIPC